MENVKMNILLFFKFQNTEILFEHEIDSYKMKRARKQCSVEEK